MSKAKIDRPTSITRAENTFEERCRTDPQGVIFDLVAQTKRQAATIYEQGLEIARLKKQLAEK